MCDIIACDIVIITLRKYVLWYLCSWWLPLCREGRNCHCCDCVHWLILCYWHWYDYLYLPRVVTVFLVIPLLAGKVFAVVIPWGGPFFFRAVLRWPFPLLLIQHCATGQRCGIDTGDDTGYIPYGDDHCRAARWWCGTIYSWYCYGIAVVPTCCICRYWPYYADKYDCDNGLYLLILWCLVWWW